MEDSHIQRDKLDQLRKPTAIIHGGMFIYANAAFLQRLGYREFAELEGIPVLDLVVPRYHGRLKDHLARPVVEEVPFKDRPRARLALKKSDGSHLVAIVTSHRLQFEGENAVELSIRTQEDLSLKNTFLGLPWKFYLSAFFLLLFTILPNLLLLNLNFNNAPKVYLPPDAPALLVDEKLREKFPNDQVILLLFEGVALYSDGFLNAFDALAEKLESNPLIDDVLSITTQDHIGGTAEGFSVEPLIDTTKLDTSRPIQRMQHALSDRFANRSLISQDGSALAMVVVPVTIGESILRMELENQIMQEIDRARLRGYLTATAGYVVTDVAQLRSMLRDNMIFIPATVIVGLLLIWWLFRRLLVVLVGGIAIGVVTSTTVAFHVVFNQPFNLISSIIPPLLSALTVATLVHLFNALHYASNRGLSGVKRVQRALAEVKRPAFYASVTTAVGLASLGLSPIPPISTFGLICAGGVVMIYFIVIVVVPNIFAHFDHSPWPRKRGGLVWMDRLVNRLFHLGVRFPVHIVVITSILLLAMLPQLRNIVVETNLQEFFHADHPVKVSNTHIQETLVGTNSLNVVFVSQQPGGLKSPHILGLIREFQRWVETLPEVDKSISPVDFIEEMHWGFNEEKPLFRTLPADERLISQYIFVYDGDGLYDFVDRGFQTLHVNLNVNVHSANEISSVMEQIRDYLTTHVADQVGWDIAGVGRMFADQEDLLIEGQVYSLGAALILIFLIMLIQWRSISGALLCMIPNLSPILMIFIVMGAAGIWLDMATAMIASVAVGIAVDDTIHVYQGFIARIKRGIGPVLALTRTYRHAGRAVMTTTVILCAQFLVLVTSQFVPTAHFGLITSIGLLTALLFDLVLLPAILMLIYRRKRIS